MFLVVLVAGCASACALMVQHSGPPARRSSNLLKHSQDVAYFLHVPGIAGPLFAEDSLRRYGVREETGEGCLGSIPQEEGVLGTILMFKEPRHHVANLYDACRSPHAEAQRERMRPPGSPKMPETFGEWVHQWRVIQDGRFKGDPNDPLPANTSFDSLDGLSLYAGFPYQCYAPVNLQVQRLLCRQPLDWEFDSDFFQTLEPLARSLSVGLAEYHQASVCLLELKLLVKYGGAFPPYCNRSNEVAWRNFPSEQQDHGATDVDSLPQEVLREVDTLTYGDKLLYHWSIGLFLVQVRALEAAFGTVLLTDRERSALGVVALEQ